MAEHSDGGGGGSGAGFFLAFFLCVAAAWFFAEMQKEKQMADYAAPAVTETDSVYEHTLKSDFPRTQAPMQTPGAEHGITYYLDEEGSILDVVRF
jgi:hypothetical protein